MADISHLKTGFIRITTNHSKTSYNDDGIDFRWVPVRILKPIWTILPFNHSIIHEQLLPIFKKKFPRCGTHGFRRSLALYIRLELHHKHGYIHKHHICPLLHKINALFGWKWNSKEFYEYSDDFLLWNSRNFTEFPEYISWILDNC